MKHPLHHYLVALLLTVLANYSLLNLVIWVNTLTQPQTHEGSTTLTPLKLQRPEPAPTQPLAPASPLQQATHSGLALPSLSLPSAISLKRDLLDTLELDTSLEPLNEDTQDGALIFREDAVDKASRAISRVPPHYPRFARTQKIEGHVVFRIIINTEGLVESTEVLESHPKGIFDASAERAIAQFRYTPARVDGQPVRSFKRQKITFALRK